MKNIIFIAPPAAGKGTHAKLLAEKYNIPHISTGDLLREEAAKSTDLGLKIKNIMKIGALVSDDVITELLKNRLVKDDCDNGYILDGYPRSLEQAFLYEKLLDSINKELGVVIFLDISKELAMKRALSRLVCSNCGSSYNLIVEELKPKKENICDKCGIELKVRNDDNEKTFINRYETYVEKTHSLIDYYKEKGVLEVVRIEEQMSALEIFSKIEEIVNND